MVCEYIRPTRGLSCRSSANATHVGAIEGVPESRWCLKKVDALPWPLCLPKWTSWPHSLCGIGSAYGHTGDCGCPLLPWVSTCSVRVAIESPIVLEAA